MARVLVVDDERSIRLTLGQFLRQEGHDVEAAEDADSAKALFGAGDFDVVITDIILPRVSGVELLRWIHAAAPDVPVIIMTGEPTVETAVDAVRAGAHEYLCKPITKAAVVSAAAKAARWKAVVDERRRLEAQNQEYQRGLERLVEQRTQELRQSLQFLETLMGALPTPVFVKDPDGVFRTCNSAYARGVLGLAERDVIGRRLTDLPPFPAELAQTLHDADLAFMRQSGAEVRERTLRCPDGVERTYLVSAVTFPRQDGAIAGMIGVMTDITERKRNEQALAESNRQLDETLSELRRTQQRVLQQERLNALGQLAGGIAHDFNNMLIPIIAYSSLIVDGLPNTHPLYPRAEALLAAAERSASLPRQLLAFSRKQVQELQVLDLNSIVVDMRKMLGRLVREDIDIAVETAPSSALIMADPGQIEQVVLNLVLNARDAMPDGGKLVVRVGHDHLDSGVTAVGSEIPPGPYVCLTVSDTGCGMSAETLDRIFEPFFTTKEEGKGTGLGLASVYGIVQQTRAYVRAQSELGKGSVFQVLFPVAQPGAPEGERPQWEASAPGRRGEGTILLVDDNPAVREAVAETLTEAGYTVVCATSGAGAIEEATRRPGAFHLLITDVVMPGLSGRETAERISAIQPGIRVLFMSGHTEDVVVRRGVLDGEMKLLRKPFSPRALREAVQQMLA